MATIGFTTGCNSLPASSSSAVQGFILAGESNMEGQGVVDLDLPRYYNGGKGILNHVMANPKNAARYSHLKDAEGNWTAVSYTHLTLPTTPYV